MPPAPSEASLGRRNISLKKRRKKTPRDLRFFAPLRSKIYRTNWMECLRVSSWSRSKISRRRACSQVWAPLIRAQLKRGRDRLHARFAERAAIFLKRRAPVMEAGEGTPEKKVAGLAYRHINDRASCPRYRRFWIVNRRRAGSSREFSSTGEKFVTKLVSLAPSAEWVPPRWKIWRTRCRR